MLSSCERIFGDETREQRRWDKQQTPLQRQWHFALSDDDRSQQFQAIRARSQKQYKGPRHWASSTEIDDAVESGDMPNNMPRAETRIGNPIGMNGASATAAIAPKTAAFLPFLVRK